MQIDLFQNTNPECLEMVHTEVVPAGQGFGGDDAGHHLFVQAAFFKKVLSKYVAPLYEFDMVMNVNQYANNRDGADIVALAF